MKKFYCQCVYNDGKKVHCELESNLDMKFQSCPYDRGFANWVEWKHSRKVEKAVSYRTIILASKNTLKMCKKILQ